MRILEDKYLTFDGGKELNVKYFVKYILARILQPYYRLMYAFFSPHVPTKKYNVSVCAIFRDEGKYLKEWIEYHRIIGVEHFYLYNNFSKDNYKEILDSYIEEGVVTLVDWAIPQGQMKAYADCVEKYSSETNWLGFIDLDEFVVPNHDDSIQAFLRHFRNRPIVIIYWRYMGSSGLIDRDIRNPITEDFILGWRKYANIGKLFFNTSYDYADDSPKNMYMHHRWARYKGHLLPPVNCFNHSCVYGEDIVDSGDMPAQINHYLVKSFHEYAEKKKRGGGVHKDMHDMTYFWHHDMKCVFPDYHIFKYLVKLKLALQNKSSR